MEAFFETEVARVHVQKKKVRSATGMAENTLPRRNNECPSGWREADRLAALLRYGILDTPPESEFDDITRVAALVCHAPMAVVNLVADTRQFFKSEVGLGVREMPLDVSICAHAILEPDILVVPDLAHDRRFDSNPLVAGTPHLRFYAGARLDTPEGLPLGTVCILDYHPRPEGLTSEQREVLLALARQTMTHLELRRTIRARDLLAHELSHRIKNVFSVVGGLASASAHDHETRAFAAEFRARIGALARAHDYVLPADSFARNVHESTLQGLLQMLLRPYDQDGTRITIAGDDLPLGQSAGTTLALIFHEQATNAIKYGALSNAEGQVHVDCRTLGDTFEVTWQEQGGPPIAGPPVETGFGTTMASSGTDSLGGTMTAEWKAAGLRMTLRVPVRSLIS